MYNSKMAECNDNEVLAGVQIEGGTAQDAYSMIQMNAICRKLDGSERMVKTPTSFSGYNSFNRLASIADNEALCLPGQYGAGAALENIGGAIGTKLRCGHSAAPSDNMNHVISRFWTTPPAGVSYRANPEQPWRRGQINATEAAIARMPPN